MIATAGAAVPSGTVVTEELATDFDGVYRDHADSLYRYCLSQLGDPHRAEDAAADAFSFALASWPRVRPDGDGVRPWLFRIARNACIDEMRRHGRLGRLHLRLIRRGGAETDVESTAIVRDELRSALAALGRLGNRDRQLVGLRIAAGLSHAEIAEVTGMTEAAVRQAVRRALERVRATGSEEHP